MDFSDSDGDEEDARADHNDDEGGSSEDNYEEEEDDYNYDDGGGVAEMLKLAEEEPFVDRVEISAKQDGDGLNLGITLKWFRGEGLIFTDRLFDVDMWRRFGKAILESEPSEIALETGVVGYLNERDAELLVTIRQCARGFFAEVKHLQSVLKATAIDLEAVSINDLSEFILKNDELRILKLENSEPVSLSLEEGTNLARAISNAKLERFNIQECDFVEDETFERILEGCASVVELDVRCDHSSQCNAVADLIRDEARVIKELEIDVVPIHFKHAMRVISAGLVGNTQLKRLDIYYRGNSGVGEKNYSHFEEQLLCDNSSIKSIISSNHTLERVRFNRPPCYGIDDNIICKPTALEQMNKNENKEKVIRNKILKFYFVGKFDVSPFVSMPVSVLPEVIGQIEGKDKQSAIYRLLRCMPELCNVSDRTASEQPSNKRMKMSEVQNSSSSTYCVIS